ATVVHERERRPGAAELHALVPDAPGAQPLMPRDRRGERGRGGDVLDADPLVVDVAAAAGVVVCDGLDAVAVGIAQERPVVVGRVQRPLAGTAVVLVSGRDAG